MNLLDIILIIPLILGGIGGFRRGLFLELATLTGLILGVFLAAILADVTGQVITAIVDWNPIPFMILVFIIVFVVVWMLVRALGAALTKLFKVVMLNFFNRLAGMAFGIIKYAFLISLLLIFINYLDQHFDILSAQAREGSFLYPVIEGFAPWVLPPKEQITLPSYQL